MKNFEWERCVLLAELLGEAQAAMEDACAWTNERMQFGKGLSLIHICFSIALRTGRCTARSTRTKALPQSI